MFEILYNCIISVYQSEQVEHAEFQRTDVERRLLPIEEATSGRSRRVAQNPATGKSNSIPRANTL